MQSNPIVERQQAEEAERRAKESFRYPFRIVCVFLDPDNNDFPIIREMNEYSNKNNLIFVKRQYDVDKYSEDMYILRLPAFHIYHRGYSDTTYFDIDPIRAIQLRVWEYQDEQRAKERARQRRQEKWNATVESVKEFFSLERFKRKPVLDLEASLSHARDDSTTSPRERPA
jgi:hypothetical protein